MGDVADLHGDYQFKEDYRISKKKKSNKLMEIVEELEKTMQCNCDLDAWQPERSTGHSHVCRIHNAAKERFKYGGK